MSNKSVLIVLHKGECYAISSNNEDDSAAIAAKIVKEKGGMWDLDESANSVECPELGIVLIARELVSLDSVFEAITKEKIQ